MSNSSRSSSPSGKVGRTRAYIKLRRTWLAANAHRGCAHCHQPVVIGAPNSNPRQATVDHIVEVDLALVDPLDTSYWLVACRGCNSSRGARYRQTRIEHHSEPW